MKGKILTIAIIIIVFGYFIKESLRDDSVTKDPNGFVLSGDDTLGRDWGAIAAQRERMAAMNAAINGEEGPAPDYANPNANPIIMNIDNYNGSLLQENDPYASEKIDQNNYTTVEAGDGREIITGYEREEEKEALYRFQTRHQKESRKRTEFTEPQIKFKE